MDLFPLQREIEIILQVTLHWRGRCGGLVVSALDSGSRGPGSSPARVIVLFLGTTLHSHSASLHPGI